MRLDELRDRQVALLGFGEDNRAALPHILDAAPSHVCVADDDEERRRSSPADVEVVPLADALRDHDVLVRSPGFPRYRPDLEAAVSRGATVTTPTDLWLGTHGPRRRVVAVTGTKGKSTTTDFIDRFAHHVGLDLGAAGNMGIPVFSSDWNHEAPDVALEISSYQAVDLDHLPDIAVLTSLAEDHLSWHGGYDQYVADKLRVLHQDGRTAATILVAADDPGACDVTAAWSPVRVTPPPGDPGPPPHRLQNAALAAEVVRLLSGTEVAEETVVETAHHALPGRLDLCREVGGMAWVDDALASNPFAAAAGLAWARKRRRPTIVVLGGADRGVDPTPLVDEASRWASGTLRVVTLPDNGDDLARLTGLETVGRAHDLSAAVALAVDACSNGIVLFAPAAPTPPGIGTWQTRSTQFRDAIDELT
jgi:UDP-N-acetylmuramoylalanine--D-glutamate ligase